MNLNSLRDKAYKIACEHGFHDKEYSDKHWLMLVITELSEAVEADKKDSYFDSENNDVDAFYRAVQRKGFSTAFETYVKDTVSDEIADVVIRCLDFCGMKKFDLSETQEMIEDDKPDPCPDETDIMTEIVYNITSLLFNHSRESELRVQDVIIQIFGLSEHLHIDLEWHIEQKMKYNSLRPYKHGKEY